jgi:hypothetical protein
MSSPSFCGKTGNSLVLVWMSLVPFPRWQQGVPGCWRWSLSLSPQGAVLPHLIHLMDRSDRPPEIVFVHSDLHHCHCYRCSHACHVGLYCKASTHLPVTEALWSTLAPPPHSPRLPSPLSPPSSLSLPRPLGHRELRHPFSSTPSPLPLIDFSKRPERSSQCEGGKGSWLRHTRPTSFLYSWQPRGPATPSPSVNPPPSPLVSSLTSSSWMLHRRPRSPSP